MDNDLRISTITSVLKLSKIIDLEKIYKQLPISEKYIPYIEYGCNNPPRGFSEKSLIKKRKKKQKKIFYNQATIHVIHDGKIMNVKLFNNGRIQITGLKNENQAGKLVKKLIQYFKDFDVIGEYSELIENKIVLIKYITEINVLSFLPNFSQNIEAGPIKLILLNFFLYLLEDVTILILLIFFDKKLEIINKFLSAPPPSIDGKKIIISSDFIV